MTKKDLGTLAVRLLAVWLLVLGVESLLFVLSLEGSSVMPTWIATTVLLTASGAALWRFSKSLSELVLPGDDNPVVWPSADAASLLAAGIFVIGVAIVAGALPHVLTQAYTGARALWRGEPVVDNKILYGLLETVVGLTLIFAARPLAQWASRSREESE